MSEKTRRYFYSLMTDAPAARGPLAAAVKFVLSILSFIYLCGLSAAKSLYRMRIFKSYRPKCRVISVGNITLGGTGKTPLVVKIAERLKSSGKKVVIISRGYMSCKGAPSDEVQLLKTETDTPVYAGKDKSKSAKRAVEEHHPDVILLDDGFQHWALRRDLDMITINNNDPFGNGRLIPRGILREPLSSIRRAQLAIVTKVSWEGDSIAKAQALKRRLKTINKDIEVFTSSYLPSKLIDIAKREELKVSSINGKKVALVCGIADPASFEDSVRSLGADIALTFYYMDHDSIWIRELNDVFEECRTKGVNTVVTTRKDLARMTFVATGDPEFAVLCRGIDFLALDIEMKIEEEERFFGRLYSLFAG